MLSLRRNIEEENFNKLLDICFCVSSYVTFTQNRWGNADNHNKFLNEIKPFYLKTIKTKDWYCMHVPSNNPLEVYVYKADERVKLIIQKYYDNLFFREGIVDKPLSISDEEVIREYFDDFTMENLKESDIWGNVKDLPEDICFFIEDKLFLGTVSHENICDVYVPSEEIKKQLLKLGEWDVGNKEEFVKI